MPKYRVLAFIITVLAVSWIVQFVLFTGILPGEYLGLYMFVPAIIAFIFFLFNKDPIKSQIELFTRRTGLWSWVFAVLYPIFWLSTVAAIAVLSGLGKFNAGAISTLFSWQFPVNLAVMALAMAPAVFGEEYGWRGYLLPTLADQRGKLWATIITGLVWGLWHIPSYYLIYSQAGLGDPILLTMLAVITVAVGAFPYAYLFFLNGNILPCVLMHAVYDKFAAVVLINASGSTGPIQGSPGLLSIPWPYALGLIFLTGSALAALFAWRLKN